MTSQIRTAVDFYERHPISAQIILTKLEAARGTLDGLRPDELFPHDQDHYGGIVAKCRFAALRQYVRSWGQTGLVTDCLETSKMTLAV